MEEVLESGLVLAISCLMGQPDMRAAVRLGMGLLKTPSSKDLPEPITNNNNVEELRSLLAAMAQQFIQERAARQSVEAELTSIQEQYEIIKTEFQDLKERNESNEPEFKSIKVNYEAFEKELENAKKSINEWMASSKSWQKDCEFWHAKADPKYAERKLADDKKEQQAWEEYREWVIREIKNQKSRNSYAFWIKSCGYSLIDQYNYIYIREAMGNYGGPEPERPYVSQEINLVDKSEWNPLIFCRGDQTVKHWFHPRDEDDCLASKNEGFTIDDRFLEKLKLLRRKLANKDQVHPHTICSNAVLIKMIKEKPIIYSDFTKLIETDDSRLGSHMDSFIEITREYISPDLRNKLTLLESKLARGSLHYEILLMYERGSNINEIASLSKIETDKLWAYFIELIGYGYYPNIDDFVQPNRQLVINKVLNTVGNESLSNIFDHLNKEFSYNEIRIMKAIWQYEYCNKIPF